MGGCGAGLFVEGDMDGETEGIFRLMIDHSDGIDLPLSSIDVFAPQLQMFHSVEPLPNANIELIYSECLRRSPEQLAACDHT